MTSIEFRNIIQKETAPLRHYAYQLTRNTEDTNDLLQDTMLKALLYQNKFSEGTNLRGWLYTIMKNTFINNYRRMLKRSSFMESTDNDYVLDAMTASVYNEGDGKMVMKDIESAIDMLPLTLKKPFTMNFKGFKYHEISAILKIPIGTVKTRIFMARRQLRGQLNVYGRMYGLEQAV